MESVSLEKTSKINEPNCSSSRAVFTSKHVLSASSKHLLNPFQDNDSMTLALP